MNEGEIRQLAQLQALISEMNAVIANVEGMRADNKMRESQGWALAWDGSCFFSAEEELKNIASRMRNEI